MSPISPTFLEPNLVPPTIIEVYGHYRVNMDIISRMIKLNEDFLMTWTAQFSAPGPPPGLPVFPAGYFINDQHTTFASIPQGYAPSQDVPSVGHDQRHANPPPVCKSRKPESNTKKGTPVSKEDAEKRIESSFKAEGSTCSESDLASDGPTVNIPNDRNPTPFEQDSQYEPAGPITITDERDATVGSKRSLSDSMKPFPNVKRLCVTARKLNKVRAKEDC